MEQREYDIKSLELIVEEKKIKIRQLELEIQSMIDELNKLKLNKL